jgi:hypothetical protein
VTRYVPSRYYFQAGLVALGAGAFSFWWGLTWTPAFIPAALCAAAAGLLIFLATRPAIEVHETHLTIGTRIIPWPDIRRVDRGWDWPLLVHLTLHESSRVLLIYPGNAHSARTLLRQLRRNAREALIDGTPYRRYWRDSAAEAPAPPRYHLLRPEDEAEVERLYQRLKSVRSLDPDRPADEK